MELDLKDIKEKYQNGYSIAEIARNNNVSPRTIQRRLIKINCWDCGKLPSKRRKSKYIYDETFFNIINTEEKAYWLGFIAADGNVTIDSNSRHYLRIKLQKSDSDHLEKFLTSIKGSYPIIIKDNTCIVAVCGPIIVNDLINHGIVPNKTHILDWPTLPENLYAHYCRGYFDGDGCWSIDKKNNAICNLCGNFNFIEKFRDHLYVNCCLKRKTKIYKKATFSGTFTYGGNLQCRRIYSYFYDNATIYMDRKKDKVASLLSCEPCPE